MKPRFSIVIPARDEEHYLPACLDAIDRAATRFPGDAQVIVVINRCTDRTEEIARSRGALVVHDDSRCLSAIRNAGARAATGEILVTIDADSTMSPGLLRDVDRLLRTGKYVGGGTRFSFDRRSILLSIMLALVVPLLVLFRVASGCFWCFREDFERICCFDDNRIAFEDVDFALRLKRHGKRQGKRFKVLLRSSIRTSARKFDVLGDTFFLRHPRLLLELFRGVSRETANRLWYDFPRKRDED